MGRLGLQSGEVSTVSVGSTTTAVLTAVQTEELEYIALTNISDERIFVAFGASAELNKGIALNAEGGNVVWETGAVPRSVAINAISSSGSKTLCVHTGT